MTEVSGLYNAIPMLALISTVPGQTAEMKQRVPTTRSDYYLTHLKDTRPHMEMNIEKEEMSWDRAIQ